jgi:S1-C subfamily serine protease
MIDSVYLKSPADIIGLKTLNLDKKMFDIITAIDGYNINSMEALSKYIDRYKSTNDPLKLTVNRNGQTQEMYVILKAIPSSIL